jgi:DNA adenine methylase
LLGAILPFVPKVIGRYHEPFLGGGAMFFAVRLRISGSCYLADLNSELINTWRVVRDNPMELHAALNVYRGFDTEVDYYTVREGDPPEGDLERAARFLYLNQTAWNSLWRVNRWGRFNVPWGARPFRGFEPDELRRVAAVLQRVNIEEADFHTSLDRACAGDFVYIDPPYLPISDTSKFSGYTKRRFRAADLAELAERCRSLSDRGVYWIVSNRDNTMVRDLFAHAQIVKLTTRRSVAAQNRRDVQPANSPEAIIIGGPTA